LPCNFFGGLTTWFNLFIFTGQLAAMSRSPLVMGGHKRQQSGFRIFRTLVHQLAKSRSPHMSCQGSLHVARPCLSYYLTSFWRCLCLAKNTCYCLSWK